MDRQQTTGNVILLSTSGEGALLPEKGGHDFDAISGASVKENVHDAARDFMERTEEKRSHENQL